MQPEIIKYYTLCSLLVGPRKHMASYLQGKKQKLITVDEVSTFFNTTQTGLVPKESVIGGREKTKKIYIF